MARNRAFLCCIPPPQNPRAFTRTGAAVSSERSVEIRSPLPLGDLGPARGSCPPGVLPAGVCSPGSARLGVLPARGSCPQGSRPPGGLACPGVLPTGARPPGVLPAGGPACRGLPAGVRPPGGRLGPFLRSVVEAGFFRSVFRPGRAEILGGLAQDPGPKIGGLGGYTFPAGRVIYGSPRHSSRAAKT